MSRSTPKSPSVPQNRRRVTRGGQLWAAQLDTDQMRRACLTVRPLVLAVHEGAPAHGAVHEGATWALGAIDAALAGLQPLPDHKR